MNVGLGWLGVGVGAVGCVATYLMAGGSSPSSAEAEAARDRRTAWLCAGATLVVTLIFWAVAMQRRVPFSPGQGLAFGFLIGGLAGAVAILLTFRLSEIISTAGSLRSARLGTLSSLFFGLLSVSLAYTLFSSDPSKPLMGFAIGAAMAAIFHTYMQYTTANELPVRTEIWAVFVITIVAAIALAMAHFDATQFRMWWPLPILIATSVLIADYVGIELGSLGKLRENAGKSYLVTILIAAALVTGLSAIYSWKVFDSWQLLQVAAIGLGIGAVIAWLFAGLTRDDGSAGALEAGAVAVVLVMAFVVVAFKLWAGLGIALGLVAAWTIAIPALAANRSAEERPKFLADAAGWPLALGLVIILFRLFIQYYHSDLRAADLEIHYTFIGAMLGALLPFVLLAGVIRLRDARVGNAAIAGVALMGLIAAASPVALVVLWGLRTVLGFSFGLTAAIAFMLLARLGYGDMKYSIGLLAVAAQLVALEFVGTLADLEITRGVRIAVLAAIVVLAVVWFGLSSVFAARTSSAPSPLGRGEGEGTR